MVLRIHCNSFLKCPDCIPRPTTNVVQCQSEVKHCSQQLLAFRMLPHSTLVFLQKIARFYGSFVPFWSVELLCSTCRSFQMKACIYWKRKYPLEK